MVMAESSVIVRYHCNTAVHITHYIAGITPTLNESHTLKLSFLFILYIKQLGFLSLMPLVDRGSGEWSCYLNKKIWHFLPICIQSFRAEARLRHWMHTWHGCWWPGNAKPATIVLISQNKQVVFLEDYLFILLDQRNWPIGNTSQCW